MQTTPASSMVALLLSLTAFATAKANVRVPAHLIQYKNADHVLSFEVLNNTLIHFDYSAMSRAPEPTLPLATTPLVSRKLFSGPSVLKMLENGFATPATQITVEPKTLCFTLTDLSSSEALTRMCPRIARTGNLMTMSAMKTQNIYGLGEQFQTPNVINGDWSGKVRTPGAKFGNAMVDYENAAVGNSQFPIFYALGPDYLNYALFLDTVYPYRWDFTTSNWKITQAQTGSDPAFRGYLMVGADLPTLRSSFLDLVGRPPVPPKKALGLWVSEYGYRNWSEIEDKLSTLRAHHFPIDGFVLDLYWFGGSTENDPQSQMGQVAWDTVNFPNPKERISRFQNDDGIGLMTIEESYVSSGLPNYQSLLDHDYFVNKNSTPKNPTVYDAWWGHGAGIDWTNSEAGAFWHNRQRKPQLTDLGVTFHWTDLGEPENYEDFDYYHNTNGIGHLEADGHNLFNFLWNKSIHDGYVSNHENQRHFILTRSGTAGIERFGSAMWSGDIGSNMASLSAHLNAQMHMSLSGMDYFGADVGGFHRDALVGDMNEVYTRWFANASLFDVPLRPHTDNGPKTNPTSPDRIGDLKSNLFNLRQRYELAPYYYSLAYRAHESGEAVVPPLVYYFQNDQKVRMIADEKMIGPSLIAAASAKLGENSRDVYLPKGSWVDYHTGIWYHSQGESFPDQTIQTDQGLVLPLFAREGAILPLAQVDDQTQNMLGRRSDGSRIDDLIVRVAASSNSTEFHLVEDDGVTEAYQKGDFADTLISQELNANSETVTIAPTHGTYTNAPHARKTQVQLWLDSKKVTAARANGTALRFYDNAQAFAEATSGWMIDAKNIIHAKLGSLDVNQTKTFEFIF